MSLRPPGAVLPGASGDFVHQNPITGAASGHSPVLSLVEGGVVHWSPEYLRVFTFQLLEYQRKEG